MNGTSYKLLCLCIIIQTTITFLARYVIQPLDLRNKYFSFSLKFGRAHCPKASSLMCFAIAQLLYSKIHRLGNPVNHNTQFGRLCSDFSGQRMLTNINASCVVCPIPPFLLTANLFPPMGSCHARGAAGRNIHELHGRFSAKISLVGFSCI